MFSVLLSLLPLVGADLPVHCLRNEVVGKWTFKLSEMTAERTSCGHSRPDAETAQPSEDQVHAVRDLSVDFAQPALATTAKDSSGYFSMVYDEGLEFDVEGLSFFAFSKFEMKSDKAFMGSRNVSVCSATGVGWYTNEARTSFGCFYGKMDAPLAAKPSPQKTEDAFVDVDRAISMKEHEARVAALNARPGQTWTAKAFVQYEHMTLRQMNRRAGLLRPAAKAREVQAESFLAMTARTSKARAALPKTFDWRNVDGTDYLEPVMDQGDCGSCYVVSTVRMLSARHRIATHDTVPFSISFPLQCSEYNQGCDGGYGKLVSRWSEDVGLVPASCAPYSTTGSCSAISCAAGSKAYRADKHRYVGGYYGAGNEADMMQELMTNGPFTVGVEPASDFMYYTGGVYKNGPARRGEKEHGWERVDHAVLLVGWGEENGQPYWTIQNSWGDSWGEDGGYMRLARGDNDSGIESIPEAADVVEDLSKGQRVQSLLALSSAKPQMS